MPHQTLEVQAVERRHGIARQRPKHFDLLALAEHVDEGGIKIDPVRYAAGRLWGAFSRNVRDHVAREADRAREERRRHITLEPNEGSQNALRRIGIVRQLFSCRQPHVIGGVRQEPLNSRLELPDFLRRVLDLACEQVRQGHQEALARICARLAGDGLKVRLLLLQVA